MTDYPVSNLSGLMSALSGAGSGDTITCANGNYGGANLSNITKAGTVTIRSATSKGAKFSAINATNAEYLKFEDLHLTTVTAGSTSSKYMTLDNADHIDVEACEFNCQAAGDKTYMGIYQAASAPVTNITVVDCSFHDLYRGMAWYSVNGLLLDGNTGEYLGEDFIKFSTVQNATIRNNSAKNWRRRGEAHCDFLQFENTGPKENILIERNILTLGSASGGPLGGTTYAGVQFILGNAGDGWVNGTIQDNVCFTCNNNGIQIDGGSTGMIVRRNTLLHAPSALYAPLTHKYCELSSPGTLTDNISTTNRNDIDGPYGSGNLRLNSDNPASPWWDQLFIEDVTVGWDATLADLRGKPGTAAEGKGADAFIVEMLGGETAPGITGSPSIDGLPNVGETLYFTLAPTTGSPTPTDNVVVTNETDGDVQNGPMLSYVIQASDQGDQIHITQEASSSAGPTATAQSASTAVIGAALTPPAVSLLTPIDNAVGVARNTQLIIKFSENIQAGAGGVRLYNLTTGTGADGTHVGQWTIAADLGGAMIISGDTLTITRGGLLNLLHNYCVKIDSGLVTSVATGSGNVGWNDLTTWNFTATDGGTTKNLARRVLTSVTVAP